jgi:hypothetical protein
MYFADRYLDVGWGCHEPSVVVSASNNRRWSRIKTQPAMVIAYIIGDGSLINPLEQMCLEQASEIGDEDYSGYTRRRA